MAQKTIRCRLITPEAQVLDEPITQAVIPMWDGLMGYLPDRAPIVGRLGMGELRLDFPDSSSSRGGSRSFFVDGGFVQMVENRLTVLAANASAMETLTEADVQSELAEASARREDGLAPAERDRVQHEKQRAAAKLATLRTVKARGGI